MRLDTALMRLAAAVELRPIDMRAITDASTDVDAALQTHRALVLSIMHAHRDEHQPGPWQLCTHELCRIAAQT